jgi:phasin family protein
MAKSQTPFADFDFTKAMDFSNFMAEWKVPGLDTKAMLDAQRKNIEAIAAANRVAIEGAQAVARRQAEILRQAMQETSKVMQDLASSGAPEEKLVKQADVARQAFEAAVANMRELAEMSAKSNSEAIEVVNKRVSESLDEIKDMLETMSRDARGGKAQK